MKESMDESIEKLTNEELLAEFEESLISKLDSDNTMDGMVHAIRRGKLRNQLFQRLQKIPNKSALNKSAYELLPEFDTPYDEQLSN